MEDIDHTRTKTKSPQTNGICERLHKTMLNEFYRVAFRNKYQAWIHPGEQRMFSLRGVRGPLIFVDPQSRLIMVNTGVRRCSLAPRGGHPLVGAVVRRLGS